MLKPNLRFLHSADLHLDSPFKGLSHLPEPIYKDVLNSTLIAFKRLVDLAIKEDVDFVLIVGDLFDQESSSIKSSLELKKGLEKLHSNGIKAYISYGNHDFMMQEKAKLVFPPNTYIFPSDGVTSTTYYKNEQPVAEINGFSYRKQAVKENMAIHYQRETQAPYHISMLHGSLKTDQIHNHYAPFLIEDLKQIDTDYWALGHIHQRDIISYEPLAIYPGNIQGRHIKESGEKGCYIVELINKDKPSYQFYPLHTIIFSEEEVVIEDLHKPSELFELLAKFKESLREGRSKTIIRLTLRAGENVVNENHLDDLLEMLNESEEDEENWIWFNEIKLKLHNQISRDELVDSNPFINEVLKTIDEIEDLSSLLLDLKRHPIYRKYVDLNMDELQNEIKTEAEKLILSKINK